MTYIIIMCVCGVEIRKSPHKCGIRPTYAMRGGVSKSCARPETELSIQHSANYRRNTAHYRCTSLWWVYQLRVIRYLTVRYYCHVLRHERRIHSTVYPCRIRHGYTRRGKCYRNENTNIPYRVSLLYINILYLPSMYIICNMPVGAECETDTVTATTTTGRSVVDRCGRAG